MSAKLLDEEGLFHAARRIIDANARALFLSQACGDDAALAGRVRALLEMHEQEPDASQTPLNQTLNYEPIVERPGTRIGPYLLREQIGEGGFGLVFVAEQQEPVRRKVALKVIKPGMDTREVIARFEAERQALALMDHPNIARVLDAGATDSGRPYFVMELVRGIPDHRLLRPEPTRAARPAGAVRHGLPGGAARASERDHPPRHQAVERAGHVARRQAGGQGHRLRRRQGDQPATDRADDLHATSRR